MPTTWTVIILTKRPFYTINSAILLFLKFFTQKKPEDYNLNNVACCCAILASKIEETIKKVRDFVIVFYKNTNHKMIAVDSEVICFY